MPQHKIKIKKNCRVGTDQLLPRIWVGDTSAKVLTLGAFGGGVGHGSVQYLDCGCGYRTLGIYQN